MPQRGRVGQNAWQYYSFSVSGQYDDITVALTPDDGSPLLFAAVGYEPTVNNYTWSTGFFTGQNLVISHQDPGFCFSSGFSLCRYYIGVYGASPCNYTIVVTSSNQAGALADGVPVRDWVAQGQSDYFHFDVTVPNQELTIALTAISGDPDLLVSTSDQCQRPLLTDPKCRGRMNSSVAMGSDILMFDNAMVATYWIGVYAFTNASFTIVAYTHDSVAPTEITRLVDGVPQTGQVRVNSFRYYSILTTAGADELSITLSRQLGDPDLYVTYNPDPNNIILPSRNAYNYSSRAAGEDYISIHPARPGKYVIGVYGFSTSIYSLLATLSSATDGGAITLLSGVPFTRNTPAGRYDHFVFQADRNFQDLTFSVTAFSGDPDLFVATYAFPNATKSMWSAMAYLDDSITIPQAYITRGTTYYVSVFAWTFNCSYTIVADFSPTVALQDGLPQSGSVRVEQSRYYTFRVDNLDQAPDEIEFTLTPVQGAAYLFVSRNTDVPIVAFKSGTYQWMSTAPRSSQHIRLNGGDPKFWTNTTAYSVMVYGYSNANYTLLATTNRRAIWLRNDLPQSASVATAQYERFYYVIDSVCDVSITVTPFFGDPDLYISYNASVSRTAYLKRSVRYGADTLTLTHDESAFRQGVLYIAVYAFQNTTFQITVHAQPVGTNLSTVLLNGIPQFGRINNTFDSVLYRFMVDSDKTSGVTITLTPSAGDADLYVRNDGDLPTPTYSQWQSISAGEDTIWIPEGCTHCVFDILVYAFRGPCSFTLTAATTDTSVQLREGVPHRDTIDEDDVMYYVFQVDESGVELSITVTPFSGDPDLFVSRTVPHPNASTAEWSSTMYGADSLSIPVTSPGIFYIGVLAFDANTSYTILATTKGTLLVEGTPQSGAVASGSHVLYYFDVEDPQHLRDITVTLTVSQGSADMFITNNGTVPTRSVYQWSTLDPTSALRNVITVPHDSNSCVGRCTFFVAVYGGGPSVQQNAYSLQWAGNSSMTRLQEGVAITRTVAMGAQLDFTYTADGGEPFLTFVLSVVSGNAKLLVSTSPPGPDHNPALDLPIQQEPSTSGRPTQYASPTNVRASTKYYVSITGVQASVFTLAVSSLHVFLPDGASVPVPERAAGNFFFFHLSGVHDPISLLLSEGQSGTDTYNVYISTNPDVHEPSSANTQWHATVTSGSTLTIQPTNPNYCSDCTYFIGVYATKPQAGHFLYVQMSTTNSLKLLPDGVVQPGQVDVQLYSYFQMPVQTANNFTILLEPCTGDVDLYTSLDTSAPTKDNHGPASMQSESHNWADIVSMQRTLLNPVYVGVYGFKGDGKGASPTFRIQSIIDKTIAPYSVPNIEDRTLTLSTPSEGVVLVDFSTADQPRPNTVTYSVFVSRAEDSAVMYTSCGLEQPTVRLAKMVTAQEADGRSRLSASVSGLDTDSEYRVNVRAEYNGGFNVYTPGYVRTLPAGVGGGGGGLPMKYLLGIGLPLFLVVLAALIYLYVKNRKLSQELQIEMHDVPKAVVRKAISGPPDERNTVPSSSNKKYAQLLNQDDDDDEAATDYAPPDF